jgi:hypothetical protein
VAAAAARGQRHQLRPAVLGQLQLEGLHTHRVRARCVRAARCAEEIPRACVRRRSGVVKREYEPRSEQAARAGAHGRSGGPDPTRSWTGRWRRGEGRARFGGGTRRGRAAAVVPIPPD